MQVSDDEPGGWHAVPVTLVKPNAPGLAAISWIRWKVSSGITRRPFDESAPNRASL